MTLGTVAMVAKVVSRPAINPAVDDNDGNMSTIYAIEPDLSAQEFQSVLVASTLAARRPADDLERLHKMLRHANLIVTARDGTRWLVLPVSPSHGVGLGDRFFLLLLPL
jgi:hypothetical protein